MMCGYPGRELSNEICNSGNRKPKQRPRPAIEWLILEGLESCARAFISLAIRESLEKKEKHILYQHSDTHLSNPCFASRHVLQI